MIIIKTGCAFFTGVAQRTKGIDYCYSLTPAPCLAHHGTRIFHLFMIRDETGNGIWCPWERLCWVFERSHDAYHKGWVDRESPPAGVSGTKSSDREKRCLARVLLPLPSPLKDPPESLMNMSRKPIKLKVLRRCPTKQSATKDWMDWTTSWGIKICPVTDLQE